MIYTGYNYYCSIPGLEVPLEKIMIQGIESCIIINEWQDGDLVCIVTLENFHQKSVCSLG